MNNSEESGRRMAWDDQIKQCDLSAAVEREELNLFVTLGCDLTLDGDKWCVLYGKDLQMGISGWGSTPREAVIDFNRQWNKGE